jgi:hypothetical protein
LSRRRNPQDQPHDQPTHHTILILLFEPLRCLPRSGVAVSHLRGAGGRKRRSWERFQREQHARLRRSCFIMRIDCTEVTSDRSEVTYLSMRPRLHHHHVDRFLVDIDTRRGALTKTGNGWEPAPVVGLPGRELERLSTTIAAIDRLPSAGAGDVDGYLIPPNASVNR